MSANHHEHCPDANHQNQILSSTYHNFQLIASSALPSPQSHANSPLSPTNSSPHDDRGYETLLRPSSQRRVGRPPAIDQALDKRTAQNRKAQRLHRQRRSEYVKELESTVEILRRQLGEPGSSANDVATAQVHLRQLRNRVAALEVEKGTLEAKSTALEMENAALQDYFSKQHILPFPPNHFNSLLQLPPVPLALSELHVGPFSVANAFARQSPPQEPFVQLYPLQLQLLPTHVSPATPVAAQPIITPFLLSPPSTAYQLMDPSYVDLPARFASPDTSTSLPFTFLLPSLVSNLHAPLDTRLGDVPAYFDTTIPTPSPFSYTSFQPNHSLDASALHGFDAFDIIAIAANRTAISHLPFNTIVAMNECREPEMAAKAKELLEDESIVEEMCALFKARTISESVAVLKQEMDEALRRNDKDRVLILVNNGRQQRWTLLMALREQIPSLAPIIPI
ncbi:hypothetical protein BJ742DRAFT_245814 [Cladochytrium replicatum]|nr:hypothetical protein BJ742DRAFT_245814 [Cladochytrium replicatum]